MNDDVKVWMPRAVVAMRRSALISAGLSLAGGLIVCAVTWFLFFTLLMPVGFLFGSIFTHAGWFAFAGLLGLFAVNARIDRERLQRVEVTGDDTLHVFYVADLTSTGFLITSGDALRHIPKMLLELLLTGPRMIANVPWELRRSFRVAAIGQADCIAAIETLRSENRRLDVSELLRRTKAADSAKMLQDLTEFDGVLFLAGPPPGMLLSSELFEEIAETARQVQTIRRP